MAFNIRKFLEGIRLVPKITSTIDSKGELEVLDGSGKLNYHNGTSASPIVTEDHAATLTNKTIDADLNTISNIDDNEIKANAGINVTKLSTGVVTNTEFDYLQGVTSNIQAQLDSKVPRPTSTDKAIARYNGVNGDIQDSGVIISDTNDVSGINDLTVNGTTTLNNTLNGVVKATNGVISASNVDINTETSGTLDVTRGGTGLNTIPTDGQLLIGDGSGFQLNTLVGASGIKIINSPGGIIIKGGDASGLVEDIKNQLIDSYYSFVTIDNFINNNDLVDVPNTNATYNEKYTFTTGQYLQTIDLLDSSFYDLNQDINEAMVTLRYDLASIDTNPTVQLSRDNGVTFQNVTMLRNGNTDELSGIINFAEETLTQTSPYITTSSVALNVTTQQILAQSLVIPTNTLMVVRQFTFNLIKTGSPQGNLIVKLVKSSGGLPSLNPIDIISTKTFNIQTLSSGVINVDFGKQILKSGTYFLLFETDAFYKSTFVSGTTEIKIGTNNTTPEAKAYDGISFNNITGQAIQYRYTYKIIKLILKITANNACDLFGFGVLYHKVTDVASPFTVGEIIVGSQAQVSSGFATHTSIQNALNDVGFSRRIRILNGIYNENVTISQSEVNIVGEGNSCVINGTVTISGNDNILEKIKILQDVTINGNRNIIDKSYISINANITDNGQMNTISAIWGD
jgi:hypothetical protein